ncbi:uncharacterized protein LOC142977995 [Anticarsia gemmatalis]|uniref:uncharacterized protein LOC142977995 n=1 Tax=Anticarsia gemmatalis TaxID=129554 RepID=UPI003F770A1E
MFATKAFIVIYALCLVDLSVSKPTAENVLTEGRGFMSTVWGWITYPFSWFYGSQEPEQPINEQLVAPTTNNPTDIIQIGDRNVSISCNDQTCTTIKCNRTDCRNITCNIYDTDIRGECREYNIIPDKPVEPAVSISEQTVPIEAVTTEFVTATPQPTLDISTVSNNKGSNETVGEDPLQLRALLSADVNNQKIPDDRATNLRR